MTDIPNGRGGGSRSGRIPVDLLATVVLVLLTDVAVFAPLVRDTPLRLVVGPPFLLFLPGYALVAVLFPEAGDGESAGGSERRFSVLDRGPSIDGTERLFLSFGANLVVVPLLAFALDFTAFGIRPEPVVVVVSGFTLVAAAAAALRRRSLPPGDRFVVPVGRWFASFRRGVTTGGSTRHLVNLFVVVGLLVSASGLWYAFTAPGDDAFTEFYLVTETDGGEYVAGVSPDNFTVGRATSTTVVVANHGDTATTYTVVVLLQRVDVDGTDVLVREEREETRHTVRLGPRDVERRPVAVAPSMAGEDLRLTYLLYPGAPPPTPSTATASHILVLWIDVAESRGDRSARSNEGSVDRAGTGPLSIAALFAAVIRDTRPRGRVPAAPARGLSSHGERFGRAGRPWRFR